MNFAALSLTTVIAAGIATTLLVVALYLLRRSPRVQIVSNINFWKKAAERSRPRALFGTRIPWLPMLLSLAVALLLVTELGEPRFGVAFSGTTVLVLDADRTMGAHDEQGRRRIDEALGIVRAAVQADTITGQVAIIRAGVRNEVLLPLTHRAMDAERVLQRMDPDDGTAQLSDAVSLARTLVRSTRGNGRVVVVGDRADFPRGPEHGIPVQFVPVGTPGETLAITRFDARRDPSALGEYHVRCEVRSYSAHPARARLVLRDRGTVFSEQRISLEPGTFTTHQARGFSSAQGELSARLEDIEIDGGHDVLASDDVAYAAVPPAVATRVLLVTRGNRYLQNALAANPTVALEQTDPAGLNARRAELGRFHVLVLDHILTDTPVDHPAIMYVGLVDPRVARLGETLRQPRVTSFATEHRVLQGLRFDQIQINEAQALTPAADDRVLLRSGRSALAIARERPGSRVVALGFDTNNTDLPQRIAFPLFVHNTLVWLDRRDREFRSWQRPGDGIRTAGDPATVLLPSGEGRPARGTFFDTARAGIYHTSDRAIAVSGADEAGSLAGVEEHGQLVPRAGKARPPLAVLIAAVILFLVTAEWLLLHRGSLR